MCVCQTLGSTEAGEEPTDTHTPQQTSHTRAANGDLVVLHTCIVNCLRVCVCVCLSARKRLRQGADRSRHGPKEAARRTQRDRRRAWQRRWVDGAERKKREQGGKEERANEGRELYSC